MWHIRVSPLEFVSIFTRVYICIFYRYAYACEHTGYGMGWLRFVGSLKLQVSFAEYSLFYRALFQKRPKILRSLLIVATLYERKEGGVRVLILVRGSIFICVSICMRMFSYVFTFVKMRTPVYMYTCCICTQMYIYVVRAEREV